MKIAFALLVLALSAFAQEECKKEIVSDLNQKDAKFQLSCDSSEFLSCTRMIALDPSCEGTTTSKILEIPLQEKITVVRISDTIYADAKCEALKSNIFKCVSASEMEEAEYIVAKINNFQVSTDGHEIIGRAPAIEIGERIEEDHKKELEFALPELEIEAKPE